VVPRFVERLWRSLKYACICLRAFEAGSEAWCGIGTWIDYDNEERSGSGIAGSTPAEACGTGCGDQRLAT